MDYLFFSTRDGKVLSVLGDHINKYRSKPRQGPCEAMFVFFTGDAGTGKTMIQDALRYVPGIKPLFMGSTHVAGNVLRKVFTDNEMYVSNHEVYSTTFQHLRITPKIWSQCMKSLYCNVPREVYNAGCKTALEFYDAIWPKLREVCMFLFKKQYQGITLLLEEDYHKFRQAVKSRLGPAATVRQIHYATMEQIQAVYPKRRIPDKLIFDTSVFDEAGRLVCSWALIDIGLYYTVHELYKTGMDKPTIVIAGSCTQQNSFNDSCLYGCSGDKDVCNHDKIPINDYSMITMIVKDCFFYDDATFVKLNKHNRRTKSGDADRSANLAIFRNCLEMEEPIPESVMEYIKTHMSVSEEEFFKRKCIHLCVSHEDCKKVLNKDEVDPSDIVVVEETMTAIGTDWPNVLYDCTSAAGAMFRSANYISDQWVRDTLDTPYSIGAKYKFGLIDENGKTKKDIREYSCWSNQRKFYKNRPYTTTHSARCVLKGINGSWKDFLYDIREYEQLIEDNCELVFEMVSAMAVSLMYANIGDMDALRTICAKNTNRCISSNELLQTMHDLKCLMLAADDITNKTVFYATESKNAKLTIPKGENVYFLDGTGRSARGPVRVKLGKTMVVIIYQVTVKSDQSVKSYRSSKNPLWSSKGPKRKESLHSKDLSEEEEEGISPFKIMRMDVNSEEHSSMPQLTENGNFTVIDICPLKLNLVSTIAASQGMTLNTTVYGQVNKVMSAYNLIVMSTRSSSSDDQWFYFKDENVYITPLDSITKETIKILTTRSIRHSGIL